LGVLSVVLFLLQSCLCLFYLVFQEALIRIAFFLLLLILLFFLVFAVILLVDAAAAAAAAAAGIAQGAPASPRTAAPRWPKSRGPICGRSHLGLFVLAQLRRGRGSRSGTAARAIKGSAVTLASAVGPLVVVVVANLGVEKVGRG
jgi:hypothetical protein